MFIWLLMNKGLATRSWLKKIGFKGSTLCPLCEENKEETNTHLFWDCPFAKEVWRRIHHLQRTHPSNGTPATSWQAVLLGDPPVPTSRSTLVFPNQAWDLLQIFTIWFLWRERNDTRFRQTKVSVARTLTQAWTTTLHAGMSIWRCVSHLSIQGQARDKGIAAFISSWCSPGSRFAQRINGRMTFSFATPLEFG